jgi:3-hydroxyacyl-CoA dehydrogenase
VGFLPIDNSPVNAISRDVKAGLAEVMADAGGNPNLRVLLIVSAGELFSAGADINEFDRPLVEPSLQTVQAVIEASRAPVVAALQRLPLDGAPRLVGVRPIEFRGMRPAKGVTLNRHFAKWVDPRSSGARLS